MIVLTLVVLIANNDKGHQQAKALRLLGSMSVNIQRGVADNPTLSPGLVSQVDLDRVSFVSNDRLRVALSRTAATPEQLAEATRINAGAGLHALKVSFLTLRLLALAMIVPSGSLPSYRPGELPSSS